MCEGCNWELKRALDGFNGLPIRAFMKTCNNYTREADDEDSCLIRFAKDILEDKSPSSKS